MSPEPPPLISRPYSRTENMMFLFKALKLKYTITCLFWLARIIHRKRLRPVAPTRILSYPVRPGLQLRVFEPPKTSTGSLEKVPIMFLMHGGGWLFGNPSMDDEQAHLMASRFGMCVVSLEYRLAPRHAFPTALYDCSALVEAFLADHKLIPEMNLDVEKVIVAGFSAGSVMALQLAQLPAMRGRIKALISFFPLTDLSRKHPKPGVTTPWGTQDYIPELLPTYNWGYIPSDQNLRDPLISPIYATRETIPQPVFIVTAEHDALCREAWELATKLAKKEGDDEDLTRGWIEGGVRYEGMKDMVHMCMHSWEEIKESAEWEGKRQDEIGRIWEAVGEWVNMIVQGNEGS